MRDGFIKIAAVTPAVEIADAAANARAIVGGAGRAEDFVTLFKSVPGVDAGLAASIFHFEEVNIKNLKKMLAENDIPVRI